METWTNERVAEEPLDGGRAPVARPAPGDEPRRVLIVDDDPALRLVCAVSLEAEGLRVLEAADGLDGLEQARRERPDLVLTDVRMPRLDGFGLAEQMRREERTRRIPLIFMSGELGGGNVERARTLGALAYLTKPFDPSALAARVAEEVEARASAPMVAGAD